MMNQQNSNTSKSKISVPEAKAALNNMKYEIANELGVNLKQGYNGDLSSREAGYIGGYMVKKMSTIRTANYTRKDRTAVGHEVEVRYIAGITV